MAKTNTVSKAVLITGCSSGIGKATAARLVRSGWRVYATARRIADLAELKDAGCTPLSLDVTDLSSMEAAVRSVEKENGAVGVLVNNAGYSQSGAIEAVPMERIRVQFETNFFGLVQMIKLVLPGMRAQGWGRIINLSSMGGKLVIPGGGYYYATKYCVEALSDALRFEVKGFGVNVIIIEPGLIRSGFIETSLREMKTDSLAGVYDRFHKAVRKLTKESYEKGLLAKMAGTPEDVARVIEHALSIRRPRPRYTVTVSAKLFLLVKHVLSDRAWDRLLALTIPMPGRTDTP